MDGRAPARHLLVIGLILAVAAGLRLAALVAVDGPDLVSASESGLTAANWVAGGGYTFDFYGYRQAKPLQSFMPPLFTALVAGCLLTPWPAAVFGGVQIVLSTLTVALVYLAGEQLAGRAAGVVAAALTAVYPPFLVLVDQPTVPTLNAFLLALWLWATLRLAGAGAGLLQDRPMARGCSGPAPRRRRSAVRSAGSADPARATPRGTAGESRGRAAWAALAGLAVGLNALSRPSAVALLAATAVAVWLWPGSRARWEWQPLLVGAAVTGLTVAPWLARNLAVHGRPVWVSTNGGFSFWNGNNPFTTGSAFDVRLADLMAYEGDSVISIDPPAIMQVKPYPLPLELRETAATLDEVDLDRALYRSAFRFIRERPGEWLALTGQKLVSLWWFRPNVGRSSGFYREGWILPYKLLYGGVLACAAVGAWRSRREWRRYVAVYGLFAVSSAVYAAYNAITRYRWEMEPMLLVLAAAALVPALRVLARAGRRP